MQKQIKEFNIGKPVKATQIFSWTLNEFEDCPFIVYPGDKGLLIDINQQHGLLYVKWEKDEFSQMKKAISFDESKGLEIIT
jgi:hypothetical protein